MTEKLEPNELKKLQEKRKLLLPSYCLHGRRFVFLFPHFEIYSVTTVIDLPLFPILQGCAEINSELKNCLEYLGIICSNGAEFKWEVP